MLQDNQSYPLDRHLSLLCFSLKALFEPNRRVIKPIRSVHNRNEEKHKYPI